MKINHFEHMASSTSYTLLELICHLYVFPFAFTHCSFKNVMTSYCFCLFERLQLYVPQYSQINDFSHSFNAEQVRNWHF